MLRIEGTTVTGAPLDAFAYIEGRGPLGRLVMRLTRWLRAVNAERFLPPELGDGGRHLDIGCGDGYFLKRSPAHVRIGLDEKLGDDVARGLDFADGYFDVVSLLAVIEHIHDPEPILSEIHRVLKPGGRLILTTPKPAADGLIRLYARDIGEEHEVYYTAAKMKGLAGARFAMSGQRTFCLGLNQAFCLTRR